MHIFFFATGTEFYASMDPFFFFTFPAIYAPVIYTAQCIMLLMRAASITRASGGGGLRGGGGLSLEVETFLGPVKWYRADRRVPFGAQKSPVRLSKITAQVRLSNITALLPPPPSIQNLLEINRKL
jgi:hypothetical protein